MALTVIMPELQWLAEQCQKHDFDLKDIVIDGECSKIFTALRRSDGQDVCLKIMKDPQLTADQYQREVNILKRLKHDNIIELFSDFKLADETNCMAMELSNIGDLLTYQGNQPGCRISPVGRQSITRQLLAALQYLHGRHIIHGDIKPENVLVFDGIKVKLCDFDHAREFIPGKLESGIIGTPEFCAPEALRGQAYQPEPIDMYSLGVLHYEMAHGDVPEVKPADDLRLFRKILADIENSDGLEKLLIARLVEPDPSKRITLSLALVHPYFWCYQQLQVAMSTQICNGSLINSLAL